MALREFHDSEITALSINRNEGLVTMDLRQADGAIHKFTFSGVIDLRVTDLIQQNVISRILLSSDSDLSDEELLRLIRWTYQLSDTGSCISSTNATALLAHIKQKELLLLTVEPSRGAELVVIFQKLAHSAL